MAIASPAVSPSNASAWQQRLDAAVMAEDVLRVVQDFLAAWHPQDLAHLPEGCRPEMILDCDDVTYFALRLVSRQCEVDAGAKAPELRRMATFFSSAAHRISQLLVYNAQQTEERAARNV